jgi:Ca-activated chloride channel family protein
MSVLTLLGIVLVLAVTGLAYVMASAFGKRQRGYRGALPTWQKALPVALLAGAIACVALAIFQFRVNREAVQGTVILTLDASNSMDATDVTPTRLAAAEEAVRTFLGSLPEGFPVGLVTFSSTADVIVAPTTDRSDVEAVLGSLPRDKDTVIGDGLSLSLDQLETDRELNGVRPAAVVLLSDGLDTGSDVPPLVAADRAAQLGIPVYTVVLGETVGERPADAALLGEVARRTNATSSTALSAAELQEVYGTLGSQLSTELAIGGSGPLFIVLGVLFAVGAAIVVLIAGNRSKF